MPFPCSKKIMAFLLVFLMIAYTPRAVHASSIDSFLVDSSTRWTKYESGGHMGQRETRYAIADNALQYSSYIYGGIALWGGSIACTESSYNTMGVFMTSAMVSDATASTSTYYENGHCYAWTITIYSRNFDNNTTGVNYRTIAHEIGHAYGLAHVSFSSQIMYGVASETKSITSYDLAGMSVMTHSHMHSGAYSRTYEYVGDYHHKERCTSCKAYSIAACTYTMVHSGSRDVYTFNCNCGNDEVYIQSCSGPPCSYIIFSNPNEEMQTE